MIAVRSSLAALLLAICLVTKGWADQAPPSTNQPPPQRLAEFAWLDARLTQARPPNDHTLVVRGKIRNPYDQPVSGIHLVIRLIARGSKEKRELDRIELDLNVELGPGKTRNFDRELTTGYAKKVGNISIVAFALERGDTAVAAAPEEVILEGGEFGEVFFASDIPYPNAPVGIGSGLPSM